MKKILGLILALLLCFSLVPVNAIEEVKVLTDLGIITGYEDGSFKPNQAITRAEMAKLLACVAGADNTMTGEVFTDVPANHWANGYINYGYTMGAIAGRGDGTFDPEGNVTFNEATKMIISLLGYDVVATAKGGYPTGYLYVADNMLKITKGVTERNGSRGTIAILLYNALEAPIMEQTSWNENNPEFAKGDQTLLKDYLEITKIEGVVTDTYLSDKNDDEKTIELNDKVYVLAANTIGAENYFGYTIVAYVNEDDEIVAVAPKNKKNDTLEIPFENFEKDSIEEKRNYLTFEYYVDSDDEKTIVAKVSKEATYYLNGKEVDAFDFTAASGVIRFLDNDGDGIYDYIFCEKVDNEIIVKSINDKSHKITNKKGGSITLDPEDEDKYITFIKNDEIVDFDEIAEDDVLSIVKLYDGKVIKVYISSETVEGRVSSIANDKCKINNVKYAISSKYDGTIVKGDEGTFYLNYNGKIAYKDTTVTAAAGDGYAFVLDVSTKETMFEDNVPVLLMMNEKGEWVTAAFAEKVTFYANNDKTVVKLEDLSNIGLASDNYFVYDNEVIANDIKDYRIIQYKLNSKNEITAITIPADLTNKKVNDEDFGLVDIFEDAEYDINRNRFAAINGKGGVDKNTLVFAIDGDKELSEISKKSEVSVVNYKIFKDDESYAGLAFDCYNDIYQCMIITNAESAIPADAMFLIVKEATEEVNEDNEIFYVVEGYLNGEKVTLETEVNFDVALDEYADGAILEVALDRKIITDVKEIYVYDTETEFGVIDDSDYDYEDEDGVAYYVGYLVDSELDKNYTFVGDYEINVKNANVTFVNRSVKTTKYLTDENIEDYLGSIVYADEDETIFDIEYMTKEKTVVYFAVAKVVDGYAIDVVIYGEKFIER